MLRAIVGGVWAVVALAPLSAQTLVAPAAPTVVHGLYNWVHSTADAERAFAFYHDIFGIELAASPFVPNATAPEGIRPWSAVVADELIWDLTNTRGSRARTVFMRAPNTPFGLELSEFVDIEREHRAANPYDPGASRLIFGVRDFDAVAAKLAARAANIVTRRARPVTVRGERALLVRDPDGYLLEVKQVSAAEIARAKPGEIVTTKIGLTVYDTARALELYRGLLGFAVRDTWEAGAAELALNGLRRGRLVQTTAVIPGTAIEVVFADFELPEGVTANPFRWRIQDVGSPQFQLEVRDLDGLLERSRAAGYRFLSLGARPIQRPFGRFVFLVDADNILVEYAEPAAGR
ncbi:MAG TPA: VOC family protein [Gammaproteobacteria bacterium]|nr:VOC family protein [Gammaproteobacteria bacterium]